MYTERMIPLAWLVRHAESTANAGGRTKDPESTALSEHGHRQAQALRLPGTPKRIVVSRYIRTRQTAEHTIARYPGAAVEVWPVEEYTFLDTSKYENTTQDERLPFAEAYFDRNDPHYRDGGDAESFYDVLSRAASTLDQLKTVEHPTVVFTHGRFLQVLRWVFEGWCGRPRDFIEWAARHPVPNASVTTLNFQLVPRAWTLSEPEELVL